MKPKRLKVPSFTNDAGFYAMPSSSNWTRTYWTSWGGPDGSTYYSDEPDSSNVAFSLKSTTLSGGVNRVPTAYVRKVSRIDSLGKVDFTSRLPGGDYYRFQGDSSVHPRGVQLSAAPFGDSVSSYSVNINPDLVRFVIVEVKNKVQDLQVNLIEDLVQAKATINTLKDIYHLLISLWKYTRTGNYSRLQYELNRAGYDVPTRLANAWLAWYYGIKPVISTFMSLYDTLQNWDKPRFVEYKRTINEYPDPIGAFASNSNDLSASGSARISSRATIVVTFTRDTITKLSESVIGYSNVPANLWALAPYSFVVDWLIPVEDWLKSVTYSKGVIVDKFYVNNGIYADCVAVARDPGVFGAYPAEGDKPLARVRIAHTERLIVNPYVPGLPYVHASLTPTKLVSAAALLLQRRR